MEPSSSHPDQFIHIRIILGVVMGLSLTRLLAGLARFVQHPHREHIYLVHLGWAVFLLSAVIQFWWFEFGLVHIDQWTFQLYIFTISYAALFFFICSLLFPDDIGGYGGFADYFHSKQEWFYGLLACLFAVDVIDTLWKGADHFEALGPEYPIRQASMILFAIVAMFVRNRRFHLFFVALTLVAQLAWIVRHFEFMA